MLKRCTVLFLASVLCLGLFGCGEDKTATMPDEIQAPPKERLQGTNKATQTAAPFEQQEVDAATDQAAAFSDQKLPTLVPTAGHQGFRIEGGSSGRRLCFRPFWEAAVVTVRADVRLSRVVRWGCQAISHCPVVTACRLLTPKGASHPALAIVYKCY